MTTPTPEQFLAEPYDPAEDEEPEHEHEVSLLGVDPLVSIAASLERLVAITEGHEAEEQTSDRRREPLDDLEAKHGVVLELVEEIRELVKPSTSKLANNIRDAIARWADPQVSGEPDVEGATEPAESLQVAPDESQQPAHDAPIADWVAYAQARGLEVDPGRTNRSQIRTALGIPHGGEAGNEDQPA